MPIITKHTRLFVIIYKHDFVDMIEQGNQLFYKNNKKSKYSTLIKDESVFDFRKRF